MPKAFRCENLDLNGGKDLVECYFLKFLGAQNIRQKLHN